MTTMPSPSPRKNYEGGCASLGKRKPWKHFQSKTKGGKPRQRPNNDSDRLLHCLSLPPSSPPGTLLERIGGSIQDVDATTDSRGLTPDRNDVMSQGVDGDSLPHFYTPDPSEVEQFLESVMGALPPPPSPAVGHVHVGKPALALETHNIPLDQVAEDCSFVSFSPSQNTETSQSSVDLALDHHQHTLLGDTTMPPPSASTIEACRKRLAPVLAASAQARDAGRRLDSEQCLGLLSDDHCRKFLRHATEIRRQLSSLASQKTPVNRRGWSGESRPKRDRAPDEVDAWVRSTRSRFDSASTLMSDASRRDSDITLVESSGGGGGGGKRLPPTAPRAMLQKMHPSQAVQEAPYVASPTQEEPVGLIDLLVHQATKMLPAPTTPSPPETEPAPAPTPTSTDFVSHLSTQPGIWFKQQGRRCAEIVDVEIQVSDEIFYTSKDLRPFRLRTHLRLCSVPISAPTTTTGGEPTDVIEHHAQHWPTKGELVIQVNPESERSKTWLPHTLETDSVDVTSCVQPGRNTFRFIQLSDLSEFTFVLVASPPPSEEAWRSWDWESFLEPRTRAGEDSTDTSGLSEFARVPVIVRS